MLKHDQSDQRCGSEAGFVAMGVEARIRKASLWNEQDIVHHIHTGPEIYRNSITAGNVSNDGTDLLRHGSCWPDSRGEGIEQDLTDHRQDNGHLTTLNRDNNSPHFNSLSS